MILNSARNISRYNFEVRNYKKGWQESANMVSLDVLSQEPSLYNHPLTKACKEAQSWISGRLIINPHASYYSQESSNEQRPNVAYNALRFLNGLEPFNIASRG